MKNIMKKLITVVAALFVSGAAIAVAMDQITDGTKTYSWRYKMTVEVETPEGVKTGSAVREVTVTFTPRHEPDPRDPQYNIDRDVKGEAVLVDLGERGKVFALMKGPLLGVDYGRNIPFYAFDGPPGLTIEGAEFYSNLKAKKVLEPTFYPMFVTFTDLDDPKTVVSLLEMESNDRYPPRYTIKEDRFEEYFGEGVHLKSVTLEMTDEPITWEAAEDLPSVGDGTGFWEWFKKLKYGDQRRIGPTSFRKDYLK